MVCEYNDGGRANSSNSYERWDCAIRSVCIALDLEYDDVHRSFRRYGRKFQDGVTNDTFEKVLDELIPNGYLAVDSQVFGIAYNDRLTQKIVPLFKDDKIILDTYVEFRGIKYAHLCTVVKGVVQDLYLPYDQLVKKIYIVTAGSPDNFKRMIYGKPHPQPIDLAE